MRPLPLMAMLMLAACGSETPDAPAPAETAPAEIAPTEAAQPVALPVFADFAPLASEPVKDAIHRALRTATNQRWQDGKFSGYAVPALTPLSNGCRTVRYTVDQHPDAPAMTINACEGNPG